MNLFSTREFLEVAGALYFPGRARSVELFEVQGRVLRLLVLDGHEVVRAIPYYDFPQPIEGPLEGTPRRLRYFPRTVVLTTTVEERMAKEPKGFLPSPYVDWSLFPSFAAYEAMVAARPVPRTNDPERQRRRIARDVGPVKFVFDDARSEVFEACVGWKSAQYRSTGLGDGFARAENVELFRRLRAERLMVVSSFWGGDTLMAAHFGTLQADRLGWWIPAYDPKWQKYSPGRLMMLDLMRESFERQHREFDFLLGDEDYKFVFATHNRVVGPLGTPPLREQLMLTARREARALLARFPRVEALARDLKRRAQGLG